MFYQTVLQSVEAGGAVDVQGKRLSFIGYLQVKEGDSVWTDGKFIFGNVPPKEKGFPAMTISGIPVAYVDYLNENFKGYCNSSGYFTSKENINADDWFVNDENNFKHGSEEIGGQKVIEAAICKNHGIINLYTVTDGFYSENRLVKYNNHLYTPMYRDVSEEEHTAHDHTGDAYAVNSSVITYEGEEITLGVETPDKNQYAKVYKDGSLIESISLKPYVDLIKAKCWSAEKKIMKKSKNTGVNYLKQPAPPAESFIASAYARPVSIKVDENGDWDAIIFTAAYGYCFPYIETNGSVLAATFNAEMGAVTTFNEDLAQCVRGIENSIFTDNNFPFLQIERYPKFQGRMTVPGSDGKEYNAEYKQYIEDAIAYYIPRVRFKYSVWYTVPFGASCLLKIHNGNIDTEMKTHIYGGADVLISEWNEKISRTNFYYKDLNIPPENNENDWNFPISEDYKFSGRGNKIKSVQCGETTIIADLVGAEIKCNIGRFIEVEEITYASGHIDSKAEEIGEDLRFLWGKDVQDIFVKYKLTDRMANEQHFWTTAEAKISYETLCPNLKNPSDYFLMDGFFDDESDDGFFRFNPCIVKLKESKYLFGVHGGELFEQRDNRWARIGKKLKNFSLKAMKNLSKAKRGGKI